MSEQDELKAIENCKRFQLQMFEMRSHKPRFKPYPCPECGGRMEIGRQLVKCVECDVWFRW